jgi:hypothetical protein
MEECDDIYAFIASSKPLSILESALRDLISKEIIFVPLIKIKLLGKFVPY